MTELTEVLFSLKRSCKKISNLIRDANPLEMAKLSDEYNLSGDNAKKLDLMSNEILKIELSRCKHVRTIGSEEEENFIKTQYTDAPFMVCFDPLDGSSNISVNITTGTIFAVYQYKNNKIFNGNDIVMAGYCLYGGSTQFVVATNKINIYQLRTRFNEFELVSEDWKIPQKGSIYSINESNKYSYLDIRNKKFCDLAISNNYSMRWVGSLVADAHRTIIKGGFFSYPANKKNKQGKIRLLYEAYPFAFIFKIGGGFSFNEKTNVSLLTTPYPENNCHQKTPIILCSEEEFLMFKNLV